MRSAWLTAPRNTSPRAWGLALIVQLSCFAGFGIDGFYHPWSFAIAAIWLVAAVLTTKRWRNAAAHSSR